MVQKGLNPYKPLMPRGASERPCRGERRAHGSRVLGVGVPTTHCS